jgi:hypothetical protein
MSMSATEKVPANHSRPANTGSRCWSRALRNSSKRFHPGVSPLSPENAGSLSFLWTHGARKTRLTLWRISQRSNRSEPFVVGIRLKRCEFTLCIRSFGKRVTPNYLQWLGLIGPWRSSYRPRKSARIVALPSQALMVGHASVIIRASRFSTGVGKVLRERTGTLPAAVRAPGQGQSTRPRAAVCG